MPPTPGVALQRVPLTAEALDLKGRSLALYRDVTLRPELRAMMDRLGYRERRNGVLRTDGRRGAEVLATELVELIASGATHAEVNTLVAWVQCIVDDSFAARDGIELPPLLEAEIAEAQADIEEDGTQVVAIRVLASGKHLTVPELEERLRVTRRQTAVGSVLVRAIESELRRRQLGLYERSA